MPFSHCGGMSWQGHLFLNVFTGEMQWHLNDCFGKNKNLGMSHKRRKKRSFVKISVREEIDKEYGNAF